MIVQLFHFLQNSLRFNTFSCLLVLIFIFAFGSSGCAEDQTPEETPEAVPTVQEPPATEGPPGDAAEMAEPVAETEPPNAREEAQEQLTKAEEAVGKAEQLLQQAPMGKDSDLALSALHTDLNSAQVLLQTGQGNFDEKQFQLALTQAREATEKASAVAQHVEQAINTVK
jgi:hypothetical protein